MAALKLISGRSYMYKGYVFKNGYATDVDEADVAHLLNTGCFELKGGKKTIEKAETDLDDALDETSAETDLDDAQYGGKLLEDMNKSELETFATYKNVDIKGAKTKNDIIKKLRESLPAEELEGEIYYGSPTMVELQEEIK